MASTQVNAYENVSEEVPFDRSDSQAEPRYCCGKLTKKQLIFLILFIIILSCGLAVLIAYLVAKRVIDNSIVTPTAISMSVAGYDATGKTRDPSKESVLMDMSAQVTNLAALGGTMLSSKMDVYATINNKEVKVVTVTIPDTDIEASVEKKIVNICDSATAASNMCRLNDLSTDDLELLHQFVDEILVAETISMRMVAPDNVKLKSFGITLPFSFAFEKRFVVQGMNHALDGIELSDFDLSLSNATVAFASQATIINPSIFGFTFLPSRMDAYTLKDPKIAIQANCSDEIYLGSTYTNTTAALAPGGSTTLTMYGKMDDLPQMHCIENFIQRYFSRQSNEVRAKMTTKSTASSIFNKLLSTTVLNAKLSKGYEKSLFDKTLVNSMKFQLSKKENEFRLGNELNIKINSLLGPTAQMDTYSMHNIEATMKYNNQPVGQLYIPKGDIKEAIDNGMNLTVAGAGILTVHQTDEAGFEAFLYDMMMTNGTLEIELNGVIKDCKVDTVIGRMNLINLPLETKLTVNGLNGLASNAIKKFDLSQSTRDQIKMEVNFAAYNPSTTTIDVGPLAFEVVYGGVVIGYLNGVAEEKTTIAPDWNTLPMRGTMKPVVSDKLSELLSNYLTKKDTAVMARGTKTASSNALLNRVLSKVEIPTIMNPSEDVLIQNVAFSKMIMTEPKATTVGLDATSWIKTFPLLGPNGVFQILSINMDVALEAASGERLATLVAKDIELQNQYSDVDLKVDMLQTLQLVDNGIPMTKWMVEFISAKSIGLNLNGLSDVTVILPGFSDPITLRNIPLNNVVTLDGMDKAGGVFPVHVDSFDLPRNTADGLEIIIDASFHNPSIAQLQLGTLYGRMFTGTLKAEIGLIAIEQFSIGLGDNHFTGHGEVKSMSDDGFATMGEFFHDYLHHQRSECHIQAYLPDCEWLSNVFAAIQMTSGIDGMDANLQVVQAIEFDQSTDLNIYMKANEIPSFQGRLYSEMQIPFAFPVTVKRYWGEVELWTPKYGQLGMLKMDPKACTGQCSMDQPLYLDMEATLDPTGFEEAFVQYIAQTVGKFGNDPVEMIVKGELTCEISTNLDYHGAPLVVATPVDTGRLSKASGLFLPTFQMMAPITIQELNVANGNEHQLPMVTASSMCNPTNFVNMYASNLNLGVYYHNELVAGVHNENYGDIALVKNHCVDLTLVGAIDRQMKGFNEAAANELFENYLNNQTSAVVVKGLDESSTYPLQQAMNVLEMRSELPPLRCFNYTSGCPLVTSVDTKDLEFNDIRTQWNRMMRGDTFNLVKTVHVEMFVYNPFPNTLMSPTKYNVQIMYKDMLLGYIIDGPTDIQIAGETVVGVPLPVRGVNGNQNNLKRQLEMSCDLLLDQLYVDAGAGTTLGAKIGGYEIETGYRQKKVKISCNRTNSLQAMCDAVMQDTWLVGKMIKKGCKWLGRRRLEYLKEMRRRLQA